MMSIPDVISSGVHAHSQQQQRAQEYLGTGFLNSMSISRLRSCFVKSTADAGQEAGNVPLSVTLSWTLLVHRHCGYSTFEALYPA